MAKNDTQPPGPGVDAAGRAVIDPTANVIALQAAAVQRQDDLREMNSNHVREIGALREKYEDKLREAESKRIDAIRAVDVGAVNRAAEVSAAQATTLANQQTVSAETLRNQVAAAAQAGVVSLAAALEPIQKDIAELRKVQYEQAGSKATQSEAKADTSQASNLRWVIIGAGLAAMGLFVSVAAIVVTFILTKP